MSIAKIMGQSGPLSCQSAFYIASLCKNALCACLAHIQVASLLGCAILAHSLVSQAHLRTGPIQACYAGLNWPIFIRQCWPSLWATPTSLVQHCLIHVDTSKQDRLRRSCFDLAYLRPSAFGTSSPAKWASPISGLDVRNDGVHLC